MSLKISRYMNAIIKSSNAFRRDTFYTGNWFTYGYVINQCFDHLLIEVLKVGVLLN